jgi:hypothetical protein
MLAAQFPLHPVDNTFDAGLENIDRHSDGAPSFMAIRKGRQDAHQGAGTTLIVVHGNPMHEPNIEFLEAHFGELRIVFFEDFAHGVVNGVDGAAAPSGDKFFFAEDFDEHGRLGLSLQRLWGLEIDLIVDFTAQHSERF